MARVSYNGQPAGGAGGLRGFVEGLLSRGGGEQKASKGQQSDLPFIAEWKLPTAQWADRNAPTYFREGYKLNSAVFAVTRALANAFAEAPLFAYEDETKKKPLPKHPVRQLIRRPNRYMGEDEWWKYIITYAASTGNGYGRITPNVMGTASQEMFPFSDVVMWPMPGVHDWIQHYRYSVDGGATVVEVPEEQVVHWKWAIDPEYPYKGMGALYPVARETDTDNELTRFMKALLQNDAMPRGIIRAPEGVLLTPTQKVELKADWKTRFSGDRAGDVAVLEKGMTYERVALDMQELAFDALRGVPEARIAAAYGVPAIVAGLNIGLARSTYSNFEEARKAFTEQTLVPLWKAIASEVQQSIVPLFGNDCYVDFDLTNIAALREGNDKKAVWVIAAKKAGLFTVNEARSELGKDSIEGGDELSVAAEPAPTVGVDAFGDPIEAKEFGKKQADIEKRMLARVESYLGEQWDGIAAHVEA